MLSRIGAAAAATEEEQHTKKFILSEQIDHIIRIHLAFCETAFRDNQRIRC